MSGRIRIMNRDRFLIPLNLLDELFKMVLPEIGSFVFRIDLLYIIVFKLRVLGDKVSQNLETCDFCEADDLS